MPAVRVRELDGCGHALTTDCPEQVARLMADYLASGPESP
ncbi:alpha/beta fold hydrolase [Nonomuraea angiospora]